MEETRFEWFLPLTRAFRGEYICVMLVAAYSIRFLLSCMRCHEASAPRSP